MKNKDLLIIIGVNAFIFGLVCAVYSFVSETMSSIIWSVFLGYAITFAVGCDIKKSINYFASLNFGWIWAFAYGYGFALCMSALKMSAPIAMFVSVFFVTGVMLYCHMGLLKNTWFNNISMLFIPVSTYFITGGGSIIPYCLVSLNIGVGIAIFTTLICNILLRPRNSIEMERS